MAVDVEALYRRHGPSVLRRCRALLRDEEDAVEAMQDTFVRALRYQDRLHSTAAASLMYQMATNVSLNRLRSRKSRPEDADDELVRRIATARPEFGWMAARDTLARLFDQEEASTATMAVMHLRDGFTLAEVAESTGLSVSGVRKRLRTLRAHLQELEGL